MKRVKKAKRFLALALVTALVAATPVQVKAADAGSQNNSEITQPVEYPVTLEIDGLTDGKVQSGDKVTFRASGGTKGKYYLVMTVDGNKVGPRIMENGELTLTSGSFKNHYDDYVLPLGLEYTVAAFRAEYFSDEREYSEQQEFSVAYKTPEEYRLEAKGAGKFYTGGSQWSLQEVPVLYRNGEKYKTPFELEEAVFRFKIYTEQDRTLVSQDGMLTDVGYYDVTVYELFNDEETGEPLLAVADPVKAKIFPREIKVDQGKLDGGKFTISADYDGEEHGIDASRVSVNGMSEDEYSISYSYMDESDNTWTKSTVPPTYVNPGVYTVNIEASFPTSKLMTSTAVATISINKKGASATGEPANTDSSANVSNSSDSTNSSADVPANSGNTESTGNVAGNSENTSSNANVAGNTDSSANVATAPENTGSSANITGESQKDSSENIAAQPLIEAAGYSIQYQLNGGTNSKFNPSVYYDVDVTLKNPARKGYIFKGWFTDKDCNNKIAKIDASAKKNLTLYAKWEKAKAGKVSITSLKNSGSKKATLKFKKLSNASGYEILYGSNKNLKKSGRTIAAKKDTVTLKNLKKKNTCYVKMRAYQTDSAGNHVYGKYSGVKKVKIRK